MEKKKNPHTLRNTEDSLSGVASSSDMTGLEPTPPRTQAEAESYCDLAAVPPPLSEEGVQKKEEK